MAREDMAGDCDDLDDSTEKIWREMHRRIFNMGPAKIQSLSPSSPHSMHGAAS